MSDLSATNCGCGQERSGGCSSWIWLILIYFCINNYCGSNDGRDSSCGGFGNLFNFGGDNSCEWIIILLLLVNCCGCGSY